MKPTKAPQSPAKEKRKRQKKSRTAVSILNFYRYLFYLRSLLLIYSMPVDNSGAPWISKSTHPRKFGNHVTVHRAQSVRTTGKPMFNLSLSS